ncbi:acetyltransferase (GNAT) family protein [Hoeflea marina]|uniref:Acetyltransferase (GNAT) family protein n=1 Tax=Hoeflea marina TaxID=274592 RepID=A0A317PQE8_9HYPH|nr:GNAT family N-acetyltransferase [Hoeflea marina]PWW01810.1 acetyltransferase (GNAT) family protein [Hoeflea marina]
MDNYLRLTAKKHEAHDVARIWVALLPGSDAVIGLYAINAHRVETTQLEEALSRHAPAHGSIPAAYLSTFAVDRAFQGRGLGRILLIDALRRIEMASRSLAIKVVVLDILDDGDPEAMERRRRFYQRMGFQSFAGQPERMFLTVANVRASLL